MGDGVTKREQRPVLIHTGRGTLEGALEIGAAVRTLDLLNLLRDEFVTIENPKIIAGDWSIVDGPLVLNTSRILFVVERAGGAPEPRELNESARFSRSAVRLHVGQFEIQGFLHVPGHGRPMVRLRRDRHSFLAITSASVVGADAVFASAFVAVNRAHILAAQELIHDCDPAFGSTSTSNTEPVSCDESHAGR